MMNGAPIPPPPPSSSSLSRERSPVSAIPDGPVPLKAYDNPEFLHSHESRLIRVMCELQEPGTRLEKNEVENIVVFLGSSRARPKEVYNVALSKAEAAAAAAPDDLDAEMALARMKKQAFLVPFVDVTTQLAKKLTEWSAVRAEAGKNKYAVGTGGAPGMMEAANRGAWLANGPSVGFGISLPHEDRLNPYVTPELGFEFHYFFTRKFWMCYKCMGLVVAPGGLSTCDQLFELMTLMQTGKIKRKVPIVLIGKDFWQECINWKAFVNYGMLSEADVARLNFVDTAEEAFDLLTRGIELVEAKEAGMPVCQSLHPKKSLAEDWLLREQVSKHMGTNKERAAKDIVVIVGPSGVGKSTLIKRLMNDFEGRFGFSVSHTTRGPRPGEEDGVHYNFTSKEQMAKSIAKGAFLEHAEVHGNFYGTSFDAVQRVVCKGQVCLLDIDVQGAEQMKTSSLNAIAAYMFVAPPDLSILEERLRGRNTETEEKIQVRIKNAKHECNFAEENPVFFGKVLVNDDLEKAYASFKEFMKVQCSI